MTAAQIITRQQFEEALIRVEKGESNVVDANLIRAYLQQYERYALELDDDEVIEGTA